MAIASASITATGRAVGHEAIERVKANARELTEKAKETTQEALHTFAEAATEPGPMREPGHSM